MPIRTNRGRAAVYRRLWGWPLRSPRHLIGFIVGIAVLAIAVAIGLNRIHTPSPSHTASTSASSSTQTPSASAPSTSVNANAPPQTNSNEPSTRLSTPPETPISAPASPQALQVVQAWGDAWVNHPVNMTNQQWLAQLQPYTEPEILAQLASVNLANIPATQVTGPASAITSYTSSVVALLPTNGGNLQITVVSTPQGWQVSDYRNAS
ncbi:MAG TPA: hypothetical protein VG247_08555 [Pseudonocardiaceae bacterium]|jgi:hypothetical protein|nr:hypothetical protein [Pseudonocardiaceae bacterium]